MGTSSSDFGDFPARGIPGETLVEKWFLVQQFAPPPFAFGHEVLWPWPTDSGQYFELVDCAISLCRHSRNWLCREHCWWGETVSCGEMETDPDLYGAGGQYCAKNPADGVAGLRERCEGTMFCFHCSLPSSDTPQTLHSKSAGPLGKTFGHYEGQDLGCTTRPEPHLRRFCPTWVLRDVDKQTPLERNSKRRNFGCLRFR